MFPAPSAVFIGGAGVVRALGAWAAAPARPLPLDARWGGGGLTPLHVAALLEDGSDVAAALAELDPAGAPDAWAAAATGSGDSPLQLAYRLRRRSLLHALGSAGVPRAADMLAALDPCEEGAEAAASVPPCCALEVKRRRWHWTRLLRSFLSGKPLPPSAEGDGAKAAAQHSWPSRCGTESPSSVLRPLDRPSPPAAAMALPDAPCKAAGSCGAVSDSVAGPGLEVGAAGLQPACFKRSAVERRRHQPAFVQRQASRRFMRALPPLSLLASLVRLEQQQLRGRRHARCLALSIPVE